MKPTEKMWRTLVRVTGSYNDAVKVVIPGWNCKKEVFVCRQAIPPAIYQKMRAGNRYHVGCNIGAENDYELCFDGWEAK